MGNAIDDLILISYQSIIKNNDEYFTESNDRRAFFSPARKVLSGLHGVGLCGNVTHPFDK